MEDRIELMGGRQAKCGQCQRFIQVGMTVGRFSSPLLKGEQWQILSGTGDIAGAVQKLRQ
ncbi:MAG: hypothetical protein R2865_01765 [Deinococcales bacterium]